MITKNANRRILIVGTGYVGLVTAVGLAKLGHTVSCYDINKERISQLKEGIPPFYEPEIPELLKEGIENGRLKFFNSLFLRHMMGNDIFSLGCRRQLMRMVKVTCRRCSPL